MRRRRTRAAAAAATLALGLVGTAPADAAVAYPAPGPLPELSTATLAERYAATQRSLQEALAVARAADDQSRIASLEVLDGRDLLEFDARGNGRAVEVIGDLARADRIAIVVPGSHTTLDTFNYDRGPGGGARALAEEIEAIDPGTRVATVAWLGYDTPQGIGFSGLTDGLARTGADALRITVASLRRVNGDATISLLCHSYGSVACAYAVPDLPVADLAVYGSPGLGVGSADDLETSARIWAGRAADDWIRFVPSARMLGIGFGPDPLSMEFGARSFPAGDGGHGDYHLRGGEALYSLALIALGRAELGCSMGVRDG